jgi:hypothetical protein
MSELRCGADVRQVMSTEAEERGARLPHMREIYAQMSSDEYVKILRNRISAQKSRLKRKREEKEMSSMRTVAKRLVSLNESGVLDHEHYQLLKFPEDSQF